MPSPRYELRAGQAGTPMRAANGEILTYDESTGTWGGEAPPASGVTSVFGRTGAVVAQAGDYEASEVTNDSGVPGADVADALDALLAEIAALDSTDITNISTVPGASVTEALDALAAAIDGNGRAQVYSTGDHTNNSLASTFVAVNGSNFATEILGSYWTFAAAGGVLTYDGPAGRRYLVTAAISFIATAGASAAGFAMDLASDVLGEDINTFFQRGVVVVDAPNGAYALLSTSRIITPSVGNTLQPAIAAFDAIDSESRNFICTVVPIP